jgi:putative ABC transport system permease protein
MVDRSHIVEAESEVRAILAERLRVNADDEEAIGIWSSVEFINKLPLEQTEFVMAILAATTLLIGGIGVLNMMLDSVYERRQEIGVRLAVGARPRDILIQFFLETFTITAIGGALGVSLGVGGCLALESLNLPDLVPIPELSVGVVLFSVGVLGTVGLVAGLVPAWRAAKIDPALTLRME